MVTHSRCLGDFSNVALAQSCAEAVCAPQAISTAIKIVRFMAWFLPQRSRRPDTNEKVFVQNPGIVMPPRKARKAEQRLPFFIACVDTLAGVRYAFEFTQTWSLLPERNGQTAAWPKKSFLPVHKIFLSGITS